MSHKPTMNGPEKSDGLVVPTKSPNKAGMPAAEAMEGRSSAEGNTGGQNAPRTQCRTRAPSALDRVREAARRDRKLQFTALLHHVTVDRLRDAYLALERKAAAGVDGMTILRERPRHQSTIVGISRMWIQAQRLDYSSGPAAGQLRTLDISRPEIAEISVEVRHLPRQSSHGGSDMPNTWVVCSLVGIAISSALLLLLLSA